VMADLNATDTAAAKRTPSGIFAHKAD
jgi:hypothetical protein